MMLKLVVLAVQAAVEVKPQEQQEQEHLGKEILGVFL